MSRETIGYEPKNIANMPEARGKILPKITIASITPPDGFTPEDRKIIPFFKTK